MIECRLTDNGTYVSGLWRSPPSHEKVTRMQPASHFAVADTNLASQFRSALSIVSTTSSYLHHHKVRASLLTDHGTSPLLLSFFIPPILVIFSANMPTLTQTAGLKIAPLFIQSLVKHYYGKVVKDPSSSRVSLRDEELLYDQVFSVVKVCIRSVL